MRRTRGSDWYVGLVVAAYAAGRRRGTELSARIRSEVELAAALWVGLFVATATTDDTGILAGIVLFTAAAYSFAAPEVWTPDRPRDRAADPRTRDRALGGFDGGHRARHRGGGCLDRVVHADEPAGRRALSLVIVSPPWYPSGARSSRRRTAGRRGSSWRNPRTLSLKGSRKGSSFKGRGGRAYLGESALRMARRTVFRWSPVRRASARMETYSTKWRRRMSAHLLHA